MGSEDAAAEGLNVAAEPDGGPTPHDEADPAGRVCRRDHMSPATTPNSMNIIWASFSFHVLHYSTFNFSLFSGLQCSHLSFQDQVCTQQRVGLEGRYAPSAMPRLVCLRRGLKGGVTLVSQSRRKKMPGIRIVLPDLASCTEPEPETED